MAKDKTKPKDEKYKPTDAERTLLEDYANRQSQRHPAPRLKVRESSDKVITTIADHPDHDVWVVGFNKAMGSTENSFATYSYSLTYS